MSTKAVDDNVVCVVGRTGKNSLADLYNESDLVKQAFAVTSATTAAFSYSSGTT